ncbi:epoxyqueuosine reductase [Enterococcus sp. PF1-24]|uniref:tRNA epoxyqueuosine(34) reductase QueG n=1 Tax=unclassified Enterococcus TaxID=2608891 RepID=UPI002474AA78|nr:MULTISPECIES: tRNA epoxyqueuosine(34) reductase QueG [unclassified Enterococcus]MDH6363341.1 epoxyqueuosine reductase [Enterococcus sp. PFB1-1]MDH6400358.1 epoxyqueuosine reductase [Enterococcus sp. PF1-24]
MVLSLKEKIIAESQRLGIDKIGFATAEPFLHLEESLEMQKKLGHTSGFEHPNIEERIYLEKTFANPQSIIAIALAYPTKAHFEVPRDEKRGQFARASWGQDYHAILQEKLAALVNFIKAQGELLEAKNDWQFKIQVDTGEMVDVAAAQRAGLGFIGKNGLLITEEFGSFVYLGTIVTNIKFAADTPVTKGCGDCQRCIQACPTKALLGDGCMNAQNCLSYQSQTKDFVPVAFRKKMRNVIYGCDICQLVCPYNQGKDFHFHPAMEPQVDEVFPKLQPMLTITNKEFQQQFGHLAGSWRGKKTLQRNALITLTNLGDFSALPTIVHCTKDSRPVIRGTAIWGIGKLGRKEPEIYLELLAELKKKETEASVLAEITLAETALREKLK